MSSIIGLFTESAAEKAAKTAKRERQARDAAAAEKEEKAKGKKAAQLSLIETGKGGVLGSAPTGRKKLLGN